MRAKPETLTPAQLRGERNRLASIIRRGAAGNAEDFDRVVRRYERVTAELRKRRAAGEIARRTIVS